MDKLDVPNELINIQPIREIIFEYLRSVILKKRLLPGQKMVEREIAEHFQVSRTPVREALQRLEAEGFLERKGKSYLIRNVTDDEINEAYLLREVLEPLMVRNAIKHLTEEEKQALSQAMDKADLAYQHGDHDVINEQLAAFDTILRDAARLPKLKAIMIDLHQNSRRFKKATIFFQGRRREALIEHRGMLEAILANDEELAAQRTLEHVRNARDGLDRAFKSGYEDGYF